MCIEHRSASRHITDEQSDLATEEKERRPNFARSEIKVRLSKINSDAGREQAPPARMLISESSEANWEHVNQGPIPAVGIAWRPYIGWPDLNPAPLLCYCDRGANRSIFKKSYGHLSRQTNATVRRGKGWNIALVHRVSPSKEHRIRHSRAIEMAPLRTGIFP